MIQNEEMREYLQQYEEQQRAELIEREQLKAQEEQARLASNLHHLVSTRAIRGVFAAPTRDPGLSAHMEYMLQSTVKVCRDIFLLLS